MKWSFYDSEGFFKPWTFTGPEHLLAKSTPEGCLAIEGSFDHMSKRVVDGVVVEWRPDKPEATEFYDWDLVGGRWLKSLTFEGRRQSLIDVLQAEILRLEAGADRALRQLILDSHGHPAAARMQSIEDQVAPLRQSIGAVQAATTPEELAQAVGSVPPP